jgi:hypothetical protein
VLLALAVVMNVTAGGLLVPHNETHAELHEKGVAQVGSTQDKSEYHCVQNVANTSTNHCGTGGYALTNSSMSSFYAHVGVDVVLFVDQPWSTLNFPPPLRPPMRRA